MRPPPEPGPRDDAGQRVRGFVVSAVASEAADVALQTGKLVFLLENEGCRPCYCILDGLGRDFESVRPA